MKNQRPLYPWLAAASLLVACGSDDAATGSARFTAYGEEYIEEGIGAADVEDGWAVAFDKFLMVLGDVSVADGGSEGGRLGGSWLVDLSRPGPHQLGEIGGLEARAWPDVGYVNDTAGPSTRLHPSASEDDLAAMRAAGASLWVRGRLTPSEGAEVRFDWRFTRRVRYSHCVQELEGGGERAGIVVPSGGSETVELTLHGDHFFYDSFGDAAALRVGPIAAADASPADGEVTLAELDAVELKDITEGPYDGSVAANTLGDWVRELTRTLGHFRGEGHCRAE